MVKVPIADSKSGYEAAHRHSVSARPFVLLFFPFFKIESGHKAAVQKCTREF